MLIFLALINAQKRTNNMAQCVSCWATNGATLVKVTKTVVEPNNLKH